MSRIRHVIEAIIIGVVCLFIALLFHFMRTSSVPSLLSSEERSALAQSILSGDAASGRKINIDPKVFHGAIVAFYSGDKSEPFLTSIASDDFGISSFPSTTKLFDDKNPGKKARTISLHLIRNLSKIRVPYFAKIELTYHTGLHGLLSCNESDCVALPGPLIHARGWNFEQASEKLNGKSGVRIDGLKMPQGLYTFVDDSFIFNPSDPKPIPLYRASTLLESLTSDDVLALCRIGGDFLLRMQREDGNWFYEYDPCRDKTEKVEYNLLRHAGTTYSLYQLAEATGDNRFKNSADRGIDFLKTVIKSSSKDRSRMFVVEGKDVKLGGAGLALMAFIEKKRTGDFSVDDAKIMDGLARHCLLSQNPDGSLNSYYSDKGGKAKNRRSIYYPGEAMLGMIRYYHQHPDRTEYLQAVEKAAGYLIKKRWNLLGLRLNVPPDAWLMLALEELHEVRPKPEYADYCFDIARGMAFDQWIRYLPQKDYKGGYFPFPPQVTPAGARSEGLTAAWLVAKRTSDREMKALLERVIKRSALFQLQCMIRPEFVDLYIDPETALGVFRDSPLNGRTRIDYNQHNISGLLVAAKILKESSD